MIKTLNNAIVSIIFVKIHPMKRSILFLFIPVISVLSLPAQTTLTFSRHALLPGDSVVSREISYVEPGNAGINQVWDFSGIHFTGKISTSQIMAASAGRSAEEADFNAVMKEEGKDYYIQIGENEYVEKGFTSDNISIIYSDPITRLKFPFVYGQTLSDKYQGDAVYCGNRIIPFTGDYKVTADAYGTLILPDRIIRDVIRLKIEKSAFQVNPCNITETSIVRYVWYAPDARYPVMGTMYTERKTTAREPEVTKSAFINPQNAGLQFITADNVYPDHIADFSVVTYPNPFIEKLDYVYLLRKPMKVTVELIDLSGQELWVVENEVRQAEGLHFGEIDSYSHNLPKGIYHLRFTFDNETYASKVVKM